MVKKTSYKELDLGFEYPKDISSEAIIDDREGFRLLFSANKKVGWLRVSFDGSYAYRKADEGDRYKVISNLPQPIGIAYEVFDSDFLEWFKTEALNSQEGLRHFMFIASCDVIDVLDFEFPKIELL